MAQVKTPPSNSLASLHPSLSCVLLQDLSSLFTLHSSLHHIIMCCPSLPSLPSLPSFFPCLPPPPVSFSSSPASPLLPSPPVAASSGLDGYIKLWSLASGEQLRSIDGGPVDVWTLAFSPDSKSLASGSHNGKINLFSVEDGKKGSSLDTRGKFIMSIAYVSHETVM